MHVPKLLNQNFFPLSNTFHCVSIFVLNKMASRYAAQPLMCIRNKDQPKIISYELLF